jgi:hypothetical protein
MTIKIPTLPFPESQDEVRACIEAARKRYATLEREQRLVGAHIKAIQSFCEHPASAQQGGRDYSGVYSTLCKVCGLDR